MSEINFIMLNRFLDLKNLIVATKIMCLAQILKKILRILSFGGHLGRHLEYFNFPNDAKVASFSFNVRTYWRTHLCKNILCGLFFWVASKIFIWQPDYAGYLHASIFPCFLTYLLLFCIYFQLLCTLMHKLNYRRNHVRGLAF